MLEQGILISKISTFWSISAGRVGGGWGAEWIMYAYSTHFNCRGTVCVSIPQVFWTKLDHPNNGSESIMLYRPSVAVALSKAIRGKRKREIEKGALMDCEHIILQITYQANKEFYWESPLLNRFVESIKVLNAFKSGLELATCGRSLKPLKSCFDFSSRWQNSFVT